MKGLFALIFFSFSLLISGQSQQGKIGVYTEEHQERVLASGEKFSEVRNWAAHQQLPINSIIRLKNIKNGKSVRLTVKDRGPYKIGYIAKIPLQIAEELAIQNGELVKLDLIQSGNENHTVDYKEMIASFESNYNAQNEVLEIRPDSSDAKFTLQVASFTSPENAKKFVSRHQKEFRKELFVLNPSTSIYKVCAGKFQNRFKADKAKSKFKKQYQSAFLYNLP